MVYNIECDTEDDQAKVGRAVTLAHEKYCGMMQMLRKVAPVSHEIAVVSTDAVKADATDRIYRNGIFENPVFLHPHRQETATAPRKGRSRPGGFAAGTGIPAATACPGRALPAARSLRRDAQVVRYRHGIVVMSLDRIGV